VLAALCDIFECTAAELIPTTAASVSTRQAVGQTPVTVVDPSAMTPSGCGFARRREPGL